MNINKHGFTLIELLIVVAIIAILAAIAIPNFLAAQIRSKVSRAKADMRSYATAVEAYYVDNNFYPLHYMVQEGTGIDNYSNPLQVVDTPTEHFCIDGITTPISYISRQYPDPFHIEPTGGNPRSLFYCYSNADQGIIQTPSNPDWAETINRRFGKWRLWSAGPDYDRRDLMRASGGETGFYDPSNGTVSNGDIVRAQKDPEMRTWLGP